MNFYNKRGQITIFIIIAVVLVAGVGLFFILRNNSTNNAFAPDSDKISAFVQQCIYDIGVQAVYKIGEKGGYDNITSSTISTSGGTPYYVSENKSYMPTKEQVQSEISKYISEHINDCVNNFKDFPDFSVKKGTVAPDALIEEEDVLLNVQWPLTITKAENTFSIENFRNIKIPVRLGVVYDGIKDIVDEHLNTTTLCLSCIYGTLTDKDLRLSILDNKDGTIIFTILDLNSKIDDKTFQYLFAMNFAGAQKNG